MSTTPEEGDGHEEVPVGGSGTAIGLNGQGCTTEVPTAAKEALRGQLWHLSDYILTD